MWQNDSVARSLIIDGYLDALVVAGTDQSLKIHFHLFFLSKEIGLCIYYWQSICLHILEAVMNNLQNMRRTFCPLFVLLAISLTLAGCGTGHSHSKKLNRREARGEIWAM